MNKEQFIAYMNKKLAVIKEAERKDIIDEYSNHIDEKVAEGMSEEEVIAGFGDIDEMIKEILDAYNIDPGQTKRNADGFDRKVNDVLDSLFDGFQRLLSNLTSMDVDNIVKLMFEVLVVLVVLALFHIPFEIMRSLGSSLLRSLFGYGIGASFAWIWRVLVNLLYVVMFIAVLINVSSRRWAHFKEKQHTPVMDDVKESFNFEQAKEAVHRFTSGTQANKSYDVPYEDDADIKTEKQKEKQEYHHEDNFESHKQSNRKNESIFSVIIKFFGFLLMLPFILVVIGLCCALGLLVVMSIQGFTVIGFYFLVIGAIVGCSAVITLIDRYLCKGGRHS